MGWSIFKYSKSSSSDLKAEITVNNLTLTNFVAQKFDLFELLYQDADVTISNVIFDNFYLINSYFLQATQSVKTSPRKKITISNVTITNSYFYQS